jgi:F-type H+-transporting ATPase subunit delta
VAATTSIVSGVAERYASALFEVALENGALDSVSATLDGFTSLIAESSDLKRLIVSPVFSAEDQTRAVGAVMDRAGLTGFGANFIRLAARNRRLFAVPDMIRSYKAKLAAHRGEVIATVVSATALSDADVSALKVALSNDVGGRQVNLTASVDASLIGGLVIQLGSRMIDTSLRTKLSSLKVALKEVR